MLQLQYKFLAGEALADLGIPEFEKQSPFFKRLAGGRVEGGFAHQYTFTNSHTHKEHHLTFVGHPVPRFFLVLNVWVQRPRLYTLAFLEYDTLAGFIEDLGRSQGEVPDVDVRPLKHADYYCDSRPMAVLQNGQKGKSILFTDERWADHGAKLFNGCGLLLPDVTCLHLGVGLDVLKERARSDQEQGS